jgi:hypothetical protein
MLFGKFPKPPLLKKYKLDEFSLLVTAVKSGNLRDYNRALEMHKDFFIDKGIYLTLEKLKMITFRNLFKRV